jgi:hypothetical protein
MVILDIIYVQVQCLIVSHVHLHPYPFLLKDREVLIFVWYTNNGLLVSDGWTSVIDNLKPSWKPNPSKVDIYWCLPSMKTVIVIRPQIVVIVLSYRTAMKALFLYLNLCPSAMLNSLACSFTSISSHDHGQVLQFSVITLTFPRH